MQVDIFTTTGGLDTLGLALEDIGHHSFVVVDAADFENFLEGKYGAWDYVTDELMKLREVETKVTLYLSDDKDGHEGLAAIRELLLQLKASDAGGEWGRLECTATIIDDESWESAWKKHYSPLEIGERLVVCPPWEDYDPGGRIVMRIEPGMAFGTGIDETTRLCLEVLESISVENADVLDVGCGSGILSIGALMLGARSALGVDSNPVAVEEAQENSRLNGVAELCSFVVGNLAEDVAGDYDIVCANISADVILAFAPDAPRLVKPGGLLVLSGIIATRAQEIIDELAGLGLSFRELREEAGWVCIVLMVQ